MTVDQHPPRTTITAPSEREIRFERTFDAPRQLVWRAFTDPTLLAEWYGGGVEVEHMDVRVGGTWKLFGGSGPNGKFAFEGEYLEVDPPRRLVQTFENGWMGGLKYREAMEFEDLGDRTRFTLTSSYDTTEQRDQLLPTVEQGGNFIYSKLDRLLARLS